MKTLTGDECAGWLASRKLCPEPYRVFEGGPPFYAQYVIPEKSFWLGRTILGGAEPFEAALLHVTDWSGYQGDEMAVVESIRRASGEDRWLIEAPGHLFTSDEKDLLAGLLGLITAYGWTAYVYFDHGVALLSWEGDLLDLFATDQERFESMRQWLTDLEPAGAPEPISSPE